MLKVKNAAFIEENRAKGIQRAINEKRLQLVNDSDSNNRLSMTPTERLIYFAESHRKFSEFVLRFSADDSAPFDQTTIIKSIKEVATVLCCSSNLSEVPIDDFFDAGTHFAIKKIIKEKPLLLENNQYNEHLSSIILAATCGPNNRIYELFNSDFSMFWLIKLFLNSNSVGIAVNGLYSLGNLWMDHKVSLKPFVFGENWKAFVECFDRYQTDPKYEEALFWFLSFLACDIDLKSNDQLKYVLGKVAKKINGFQAGDSKTYVQAITTICNFVEAKSDKNDFVSPSYKFALLEPYHMESSLALLFDSANNELFEALYRFYKLVSSVILQYIQTYFKDSVMARIEALLFAGSLRDKRRAIELITWVSLSSDAYLNYFFSKRFLEHYLLVMINNMDPDLLSMTITLLMNPVKKSNATIVSSYLFQASFVDIMLKLVRHDSDRVKIAGFDAFQRLFQFGSELTEGNTRADVNPVINYFELYHIDWSVFRADRDLGSNLRVEEMKQLIRSVHLSHCMDLES